MSVGRYHCPNCDTVVTRPHLCPSMTTQPEDSTRGDPQADPPADEQRAAKNDRYAEFYGRKTGTDG